MSRSRLACAAVATLAVVVGAAVFSSARPHRATAADAMTKTHFAELGSLVGEAYRNTDALSLGLTGSCKTIGCLEKRRVALAGTFARLERVLAGGGRYRGRCGAARGQARAVVVETQRLLNPMLAAVYRKQPKRANLLAGRFKTSWAAFDRDAQAVHDACAPAA